MSFSLYPEHQHRLAHEHLTTGTNTHALEKCRKQLTECTGKELCRLRKELETDIVRP